MFSPILLATLGRLYCEKKVIKSSKQTNKQEVQDIKPHYVIEEFGLSNGSIPSMGFYQAYCSTLPVGSKETLVTC